MQVNGKVGIIYPPGFQDYAWEVEAKGWLPDLLVTIQGVQYTVTVYDAARFAQDIEGELRLGNAFLACNVIVVRCVTPESIAAAMEELLNAGQLGHLVPDGSKP